jgi:hypothetical protein
MTDTTDDYELKFEREGTTRRVLGHVTDEDHIGRGPRNTHARLVQELAEDPHTIYTGDEDEMREYILALVKAGLLDQHDDGTLHVTDQGRNELAH